MKKISSFVFAFILFASSWQMFETASNRLVVHTTPESTSPVCFDGLAVNYSGTCTSPAAATPQWEHAQRGITL